MDQSDGAVADHIISVAANESRYPVIVTRGGWGQFAERLVDVARRGKVVIVTHARLRRLQGKPLEAACHQAGCQVVWCTVPEGEQSKSLEMLERLYRRFATLKVDRQTPIISFGGGVVGDLGGHAAATYLRGLPWIVVPTTLVAQLDSAVGGKVGLNLDCGKNLIGSFYQPAFVYCDLSLLSTLSDARIREGLIEALKCGLLADPSLVDQVCQKFDMDMLATIVRRTIEIKARYIRHDTRDSKGRRIFLNLGHTIGHALERLGGFDNWSHGEAVGIGLVAAANLSKHWGYCTSRTEDRVLGAVERLQKLTRIPYMPPSRWMRLLGGEKKRIGKTIQFVALRRIGRPVLHEVAMPDLAKQLTDISHNRY